MTWRSRRNRLWASVETYTPLFARKDSKGGTSHARELGESLAPSSRDEGSGTTKHPEPNEPNEYCGARADHGGSAGPKTTRQNGCEDGRAGVPGKGKLPDANAVGLGVSDSIDCQNQSANRLGDVHVHEQSPRWAAGVLDLIRYLKALWVKVCLPYIECPNCGYAGEDHLSLGANCFRCGNPICAAMFLSHARAT